MRRREIASAARGESPERGPTGNPVAGSTLRIESRILLQGLPRERGKVGLMRDNYSYAARRMWMAFFMIITNLAMSLIVGAGIYAFSASLMWAILGSLLLTGAATANPLFALLAYPAVELVFNDGHLTKYSALVVLITVAQMAVVIIKVARERDARH